MLVLILIGWVAGAVGVTGGPHAALRRPGSAAFTEGDFTDAVSNSFGWALLLLVLAIGGIIIQVRERVVLRRSIRETWYYNESR